MNYPSALNIRAGINKEPSNKNTQGKHTTHHGKLDKNTTCRFQHAHFNIPSKMVIIKKTHG